MKRKNTITNFINAVTQSKWMRPALMTLGLSLALLVVTGCQPHH